MNYIKIAPDQWAQTKKMKLRQDLVGGIIKKGTVVYAFHTFKILVPDPQDKSEPPDLKVAVYPIDGQLYKDLLEPVEVKR